jgi:hypothetical protein
MNVDAIMEQLVTDNTIIRTLVPSLPDPVAGELVNRLKQEADRH